MLTPSVGVDVCESVQNPLVTLISAFCTSRGAFAHLWTTQLRWQARRVAIAMSKMSAPILILTLVLMLMLGVNDVIETNGFLSSDKLVSTRESTMTFSANRPLIRGLELRIHRG